MAPKPETAGQRVYPPVTAFGHNVHMSEEYPLTLRQTDQARTDFAAIESDLQFLTGQLARLPTRRDLAKAALGVIFSTAAIVILWAEAFWRL